MKQNHHHKCAGVFLGLGAVSALAILLISLAAGCGAGGNGATPSAQSDVPDNLRVNGSPVAIVHATGFQVYTCGLDDKGHLAWSTPVPDATFENASGLKGKHYGGPTGPNWEAADGSKVIGNKLETHVSPAPDAIPWLLLGAKSHEGNGVLSNVTFIQRIRTTGGKEPPIASAKAGDVVRIPYTADYVFYGPGATTQPSTP